MVAGRFNGAEIQDRDGAHCLIGDLLDSFPKLATIFADGGYAGDASVSTLKCYGLKRK